VHFLKNITFFSAICMLSGTTIFNNSCNYKFKDVSIPADVKTVKVNYIENKASYVNPQISQRLSDRLRQKIVSQTRLTQTNSDNANWIISGFITDYSITTSAITEKREAVNRLTVSVRITLDDRVQEKIQDYDVSKSLEFSATLSRHEAEAQLGDEMVRALTDEIFNRIFSNW